MTKKEIGTFFKTLSEQCEQEGVYSVIETAKAMGISYDKVKLWASKNGKLNRILQACRSKCAKRARDKHESGGISLSEMHKYFDYLAENDDIVARDVAESREKCELEEEARRKAKRIKEEQELELRKGIVLQLGPCDRVPQQDNVESVVSEELSAIIESGENGLMTQRYEQRTSVEEERLNTWREKQIKENAEYRIEKNSDKSTSETIYLETKFDKSDLTSKEQSIIANVTLCASTGSASCYVGTTILATTIAAIHKSNWQDAAHVSTTTQDALLAMEPRDVFEGTLCSRYWALHNQAMQYMNRAANPDATSEGIDLNINRATKLMRLANETLEALNRHRRKGEQRVVVQHVTVGNGGQAIVAGELNPGGGVHDKK